MTRGLFTDFYELTMAQGYWKSGRNGRSVFDYFFRRNPFGGGYSVFAGLETFLRGLEDFRFDEEDLAWLDGLGYFDKGFLDYLGKLSFGGDIWAVPEGSIVFPQEPLVRVHADLIQAQLIEGFLLNTLNFQSLIATKSARVWRASNFGSVMEFGLRRAQGIDGALSASRAAFLGGASSTSNSLAGRLLGIPVSGTMAHSWVMSFPREADSFERYAELYPNRTTFLIDTYDTLGSGLANAIATGTKLAAKGLNFGVRLDSGDIDYLSRQVRAALDAAGLRRAFIVVSNELDEDIIEHLVSAGAPVDHWGVGTHLVTGGSESSFAGVYKLAAIEREGELEATMKVSNTPEKSSTPGVKGLWRLYGETGRAEADLLALDREAPQAGQTLRLHHHSGDWRHTDFVPTRVEPLLGEVMREGRIVADLPPLAAIRAGLRDRLAAFDGTYLRGLNPHVYKVSLSPALRDLKLCLIEKGLSVHTRSCEG
ncbi:MAG TPA: nicotinate phosphoribosyltransferase [Rectinemataceae bacterium]|nr:nicotinate phosphoribosyltransferase [Rectinemataceae bacterium]